MLRYLSTKVELTEAIGNQIQIATQKKDEHVILYNFTIYSQNKHLVD